MSFFLKLDSVGLTAPNTGGDFTVQYQPSINLQGNNNTITPYELALVKANLWYSWANIKPATSTQAATNIIDYHNGVGWQGPYTIPTGQYSITDLNDYLHMLMKANGDYTTLPSGVDQFDINISPNFNTLKVDIAVSGGYQLDLTLSAINTLLGWDSQIVAVSGSGSSVANINNSINTILIHCDIVTSSYENNTTSNVIWSFVPTSGPGTNIDVTPQPKLIYAPININNQITRIRMYVTDNLGRPIDFQMEPVTYQVHLRPIQQSSMYQLIEMIKSLINKISSLNI